MFVKSQMTQLVCHFNNLFLYGLMKYFYLDLSPLEQLDSKITMLTRIHAQLSSLENSMNL
jgi:hypothetical protein